ncbi:hypothetical protein GcM1_198032 [Golovinomyces cichoracearum]|uniref:Uncharacterized protein n=1 Tax=Golovinomyces cichoracearum TaxID=62708 RepID=A0A420IZH3_9PEZI|nr:hypothetical protein GcM1_198032 [Golovinomyces cichoracearum]
MNNPSHMPNPQNSNYEYDGFNIEPDLWGHPIELDKSPTQPKVNAYILWRWKVYKRNKLQDHQPWGLFQEDFEGWSKQTLDLAYKGFIRKLRDHLLASGVWIDRRRALHMSKALEQALSEENPAKRTAEEVKRQMETFVIFNSKYRSIIDKNLNNSRQSKGEKVMLKSKYEPTGPAQSGGIFSEQLSSDHSVNLSELDVQNSVDNLPDKQNKYQVYQEQKK